MDINHTAMLARLRLTREEKDLFSGQLESIIEYVNKLNELDAADIEPTSHVLPMKNVFRDDIPAGSLPRNKALQNAPGKDEEFYRVPRIID